MGDRLIAPASALAVTLADAKVNLRIDNDRTDLDMLVEAWIRGITGHAESYMNRALITQERQVTLSRFSPEIVLQRSPLVEVVSVEYFDADDVLRSVSAAYYQVTAAREPAVVRPRPGYSWPATFDRDDAVQVRYKCGYGVDASTTPNEIKLYILAKLVEMFDPASASAPPTVGKPYKTSFIDSMLDAYRIYV